MRGIADEGTKGGRCPPGHTRIHVRLSCHSPFQLVPQLWVLGLALWLQVLYLLGELQPHTDVALPLTTILHDTAAYVLPAWGAAR